MKAVTTAQMRQIEQASVEAGVSLDTLMENAGLAVADNVSRQLGDTWGRRVVILIGPGNNGGDGLVAARHLARRGAHVRAFICLPRKGPDPKRGPAEEAGARVEDALDDTGMAELDSAAGRADVIIDAVLGTGQSRAIEPPLADSLAAARNSGTPVVAIDVPTGIRSDTGDLDPRGLPANRTLMLGLPKLGPVVRPLDPGCGELDVLDIGIPPGLDTDIGTEWMTASMARPMLPARPGDSHKGSYGSAFIVAGAPTYLGAPLLTARAATRAGAGLVFLASPESVYRIIGGRVEEAIYTPLPETAPGALDVADAVRIATESASRATALMAGPGLGQAPDTAEFLRAFLFNANESVPAVLDADALNILSGTHRWWDRMACPAMLTPHPGEMSRLLDISTADVQKDRLGTALRAAEKFGRVVILKGAATLIAAPDGRVRISPWVNPGLAKGGTGDVLAGLLAGLLAQRPDELFDVASLAVYLHGLAGDIARRNIGEVGMTAGDVADALPAAFVKLASG